MNVDVLRELRISDKVTRELMISYRITRGTWGTLENPRKATELFGST